ncbi:MAG TPA: EAL domain-containing protein [Acidimicrobiia bacterium]|nr:EAL domain-containing protein [Acidimicrobiia bacterium]
MKTTERAGPPANERERSSLPGRIITGLVGLLFVVGQHFGMVARVPIWFLLGSLFFAWFASSVSGSAFPNRPMVNLAVEITVITLVTYVIGWGALLAVGYVFSISRHIDEHGSRGGRLAIGFTILGIVAGECAVALGLVKSLMPEPEGHWLAVLEGAGVCAVIWMLAYAQRQKEMAETDLRRSEERFRALVQHASDVIMVMGPDGFVSYTSPSLLRLLGYDHLVHIGTDILPEDEVDRAAQFLVDLMGRPGAVAWIELRLRHYDGSFRWFEVGVTNRLDDPAVGGLVCNMRDVSERRAARAQLEFQAYHDALTELPNRWRFLERLEQSLLDASTSGRHVAVLFLDLDRFKLVNDTLGHDIGDRLLMTVAERLQECVRPGDVVSRFGGDEFSLLLGDLSDPHMALAVADRVTASLREPVLIGEHELFVSASVGVAIASGGEERAGDLLRQSDLAMYVAKDKGRARWALFDPQSAPHLMERLELEGDLWRALERDELVVLFQPEIELTTGRVVKAEALIRWVHPVRGIIGPELFVPFAEESGLIVEMDRFVLRQACHWAHQWAGVPRQGAPVIVSVNLSPRFMRQDDAVEDILRVLNETGVDPHCVQIELTERSALDVESTSVQLGQLRRLGVRVAIDDFGTGYSSLSYLKCLPVDVVKIDKSFLDTVDTVAPELAIVQAVITMGHALGMQVTAEGVERVEQADCLRELGCDSAMGWLWSAAVQPERIAEISATGFPMGRGDDGSVVPMRARGA